MYHPDIKQIKKLKGRGRKVAIYREIVADMETPVSAYLKINHGKPSFLLESVAGGDRIARYSFIGTEPVKMISTSYQSGKDPLSLINEHLDYRGYVKTPGLPRFCGGVVGYLSYDAAGRFEQLPSPETDPLCLPESLFMLVDSMLVFDHVTHKIMIVSHVCLEGDIEANYQKAVDTINDLLTRLEKGVPRDTSPESTLPCLEPVSNFSRVDFEASVAKLKQYIEAGEAIQVVISQRLAKKTSARPFDIYRALRSINPSPYMFFLEFNQFQVIGASPEILARVEDGIVTTRPLAGTRKRGKNSSQDQQMEQELLADEKERAEHIMLVDLGRNDIGRVAVPGSIEVSELMNVERYSHVMHMVTNVSGKLRPELNALDALKACFPSGTVSGAPKVRAMELISEQEKEKRGVYAGAAGYFSYNGNMDMAIAIRTMVVRQGTAYVQAGAGIVYDSQPQAEYEETLNKAKVLLQAIKQAENSPQRSKANVIAD